MVLARVQQALAKIYTNTEAKEIFFSNSHSVGKELGLNQQEIQQLNELSRQQVDLFAISLKRKRLGEIRKLLPLTYKCLGKDFSQLFWGYSETFIPKELKKHRQDAIKFVDFLESKIDRNWIIDVLRYERSWLKMTASDRRFHGCAFNYAIAPLIESLQKSENEPITIERFTFAIWFRLFSQNKLYYFQF
jgi:hypothetical protein